MTRDLTTPLLSSGRRVPTETPSNGGAAVVVRASGGPLAARP
jgi:hypothetical protein